MELPRRHSGFTLVEVLAAIALGGLTLVTAVSLFLAVTQNWMIATRSAEETGGVLTTRFLLQTGISRAGEIFPDEPPYGIASPGEELRDDETFFFHADGAIFGRSELGPLRVFLRVEDDRLAALLEPLTLAETNGDPALLTLPLAGNYSGIHYWFYHPETDEWEDTDETEDFGPDLNYLGAELAFIEVRSRDEGSLWLSLPPTGNPTDSSAPSPEGDPAEDDPSPAPSTPEETDDRETLQPPSIELPGI